MFIDYRHRRRRSCIVPAVSQGMQLELDVTLWRSDSVGLAECYNTASF